MAFILLIASIIVFYSLRFAPGDPTGAALNPAALEEVREAYRHRLGLDQPIYRQYLTYLSNLLRGNLGVSIINGARISELLVTYGKNSLILGAPPRSHLCHRYPWVAAAAREITGSTLVSGLPAIAMEFPISVGVVLILCSARSCGGSPPPDGPWEHLDAAIVLAPRELP